MTDKLITTEELINEMPVPSATYLDNGDETVFVIKENDFYIIKMPKTKEGGPVTKIGYGLFEAKIKSKQVYLLVVMLYTGDSYYETWWNYYQTGGGEKYFRDMTTQEQLKLFLFNQEGRQIGVFSRKNDLKKQFAEFWETIRNIPPWSMEDFDLAREVIYRRYPTVQNLWNALAAQHFWDVLREHP